MHQSIVIFLRKIRRLPLKEPFLQFWKQNPALLYGILLLIGSSFALKFSIECLYLLPLILFAYSGWKYLSYLILVLAGFAYTSFCCPDHNFAKKENVGSAYFSISSIKLSSSPFKQNYEYRGKLKLFEMEDGSRVQNIPCRIYIPIQATRNPANCDYFIKGTLIKKDPRNFVFKVDKNTDWQKVQNSFSAAESRFAAKQKILHYLKKYIPHPKSASFLAALTTGDLEERSLSLEFGRLGLQHILAISGFHFGLLALFCGFFLKLIFRPRTSAAYLFVFLSGYFFFIGSSPSVFRAWIAIFTFLTGYIFNLRCSGFNALGLALTMQIIIDPLVILNLGFQLSFICTLAILLYYPIMNYLLSHILYVRSKSTIATMTPLDQHGYLFSAIIRKLLSLNLSVHILAIPVVLFLFHKFPYLSLIYNLFIPFLVTLAFFILLLSIPITLFTPFFGKWLHLINGHFVTYLSN